jgi:DNA-binding MarR family transcriptional regulator
MSNPTSSLFLIDKCWESIPPARRQRRSQNPHDRRNVPLSLTKEGQRVLGRIYEAAEGWLSSRFAHLGAEETAVLLEGLEILRIAFIKP